MLPHLVYYQLAILVLLWLCVMLPHLWPSPPGGMPKRPADPIKPKRNRSNEPKAFEGLTKKPHCALCERDTVQPQPPAPVPPDPMAPTNRRPREIDTSQHFCPHSGCHFWGWLGLGNLRANGHPNGGPWRQFHCTSCEGYFLETQGTIFHGKQAAVELIVRVLACLAEGLLSPVRNLFRITGFQVYQVGFKTKLSIDALSQTKRRRTDIEGRFNVQQPPSVVRHRWFWVRFGR